MSIGLLNKHAPIKKTFKRSNEMPFVAKDLSKSITKRSKLRGNYLKNKPDANKMLYQKQRNDWVFFLRKTKTNYYANLDEKKCLMTSFFGR